VPNQPLGQIMASHSQQPETKNAFPDHCFRFEKQWFENFDSLPESGRL
jgi:hypothetical protein